MARVVFADHLQRLVACPPVDTDGRTVGDALATAFARYPGLRGYVLEDQGRLRKHVAVFVDAAPVRDREQLSDAVGAGSEVYVMQALSGG